LDAAELLVGDAANGRSQILNVGADGLDLRGQIITIATRLLLLAALVRISLSVEDMGLLFLEETEGGCGGVSTTLRNFVPTT